MTADIQTRANPERKRWEDILAALARRNLHRLCADVARCIDGLVVETVVLFPAQEPRAVERIEHARRELGEALVSLIEGALAEGGAK